MIALSEQDSTAREELRTLGATVLKSVVPADLINALAARVDSERARLEREARAALYRINSELLASPAHIGFLSPFTDPFCHRDLITSQRLMTLLEDYLGAGFFLEEYVVNVSLAGGNTWQKVHADQERDSRGSVGVVCNVALALTGPANGMMRMWLGSQGATLRDPDLLDKAYVSSQPSLAPGDVLVRDLSLLHQGAPNPSAKDRNLLALVYQPGWRQLEDCARGDIPARDWDRWTPQQRQVMRQHRVVSDEVVHARPYPIPLTVMK
jgi:ectoine hydroxylase-related dioxygenase (phytanoyl-CoA dioxygenase family)